MNNITSYQVIGDFTEAQKALEQYFDALLLIKHPIYLNISGPVGFHIQSSDPTDTPANLTNPTDSDSMSHKGEDEDEIKTEYDDERVDNQMDQNDDIDDEDVVMTKMNMSVSAYCLRKFKIR